jgi:hypothetical protein
MPIAWTDSLKDHIMATDKLPGQYLKDKQSTGSKW